MQFDKANRKHNSNVGFTLAELLICILILGEIATFTIPKIISSQQNNSYNAKAKEAIASIAAAYSAYTTANGYSINTGIGNLTPYLNYLAVDSASTIDSYYGDSGVTANCGGSSGACLRLHNGAFLQYWPGATFSGNATNNGIPILFDPDGKVTDGTSNGAGKSVYLFLYYNGRVVDLGNLVPNTTWSTNSNWQPNPSQVPPWFSW
jgi:type II secretory pathway pseudopilin PulG